MISLLLPSRGRPDSFGSMLETANDTTSAPIRVVVYLDDDDPAYPFYSRIASEWQLRTSRIDLTTYLGARIVMSLAWNEAYEEAFPRPGDLFLLAADDIRFRREGWDGAVADVYDGLPDRIAYVYGDDGIHNHRLGTHGFVSYEWVQAVGYFCPPFFTSDYNDAWLHDVARMIGRAVYLPALVTEHLHPAAGKAEVDDTHRERGARADAAHVHEMYPAMADRRWQDAQKLLEAMRR